MWPSRIISGRRKGSRDGPGLEAEKLEKSDRRCHRISDGCSREVTVGKERRQLVCVTKSRSTQGPEILLGKEAEGLA